MSGGNQYKKNKVTAKQTQKNLNLTMGGIKQILKVAQNLMMFTGVGIVNFPQTMFDRIMKLFISRNLSNIFVNLFKCLPLEAYSYYVAWALYPARNYSFSISQYET